MSSEPPTTADETDRAEPTIIDVLDLEPPERAVLDALYEDFGRRDVNEELRSKAKQAVEGRLYELRANRASVERVEQ